MKRLVQGLILAGVAAASIGAPSTARAAGFQNSGQSATSTAMGGDQVATKSTVFPPPNAHVGYTLDENLSIGIGAAFPFGLGVTWPDDWVGREDIQHQSLRTLDVTPAVAFTIPDTEFTVAAGAQLAFSSVELRRSIILRSDTEIQTHLGGNGFGAGGLAGLLYQPTDNLTFGLNYRSAIDIDYDGRVHFEGEEGTPFESQFVDGGVSTSLTLPHTIGLGAGWQLDRLFLELDFAYTTWSTYDEVVIQFDKDRPQPTSTIQNNWNDSGAV
ncbi:MAG: OmpP1/FadL family transporter, partial [Bradymonadaceae bacterium]